MAQKKEGYDWVTNTYYINDGGCFGFLIGMGIFAALLFKFADWYDDNKVVFWLVIIAIVALIVIITVHRKDKREQEEKEAQEQQAAAARARLAEFRDGWARSGYEQLRQYAESFSIVPLLYPDITADGVIFDAIVPEDTLHLLLYLDNPFYPPSLGDGHLSIKVNGNEDGSFSSGGQFSKPEMYKVNQGDHVRVEYVGNGKIETNNMQLAWCRTSAYLGACFNSLYLDFEDADTYSRYSERMAFGKGIFLGFGQVGKMRTMLGHAQQIWKCTLFQGHVPDGYSILTPFTNSDNGDYSLRKSGVRIFILVDGKVLDWFDDVPSYRRFYRLNAGSLLSVLAYFDMSKEMTFEWLAFMLLSDNPTADQKKAYAEYRQADDAYRKWEKELEEIRGKIASTEVEKENAVSNSMKTNLDIQVRKLRLDLSEKEKTRPKKASLGDFYDLDSLGVVSNELTQQMFSRVDSDES